MSSISERVMAEVVRRLGLISTASGYYTDAGASVHRARASFEVDALPAISVWDAGEQPINSTGSGRSESMTLTLSIDIDAHAEADADETGEVLGLLKADVKKALLDRSGYADGDGNLGLVAYVGGLAQPRPDGGSSEAYRVSIAVVIQEAFGNPDIVK